MRCLYSLVAWGLAMTVWAQAQAAVSLGGTRLVFPGAFSEVAIEVSNRSEREVLIQAWLGVPGDDDDPASAQPRVELPFVLTPALVRLPAQGRQVLRVLYHGEGMPAGRESLLHVYVLEVPLRRDAGQQLNIAVRQRINLFYRPTGLPGDPAEAAATLRWALNRTAAGEPYLHVSNPTAFHVALQALYLDEHRVSDHLLLAPGARFEWPVSIVRPQRLAFKALTDYGAQRAYCAPTTGQGPFSARLLDTLSIAESC
ncbi:molecular chaperone [Pseudomonas syringae]|nr:molecular chaperone [Pseudomonas syringae]MBD8574968.1 molecular chaperone [Pseudomonas syringae]MBD8789592.1 molecular chaperone [Pseudomonas syringae]MBD8800781.1 molecular chaperone [Pseudomonas syringae]MBD8812162.1 molecular chaperone [Pseudomonas syringae]